MYVPTALIGQDEPILDDALFVLMRDALRVPGLLEEVLANARIEPPIELARSRPEQAAALTCDFLNHMSHPQLLRLRDSLTRLLPATRSTLHTLRLMTWAMVREMSRAGITVGSHSRTHRRLPLEPADVAWAGIAGSEIELERQLECPVLHFAYPDGRSSPAIQDAVRRAGYRSAAGTERTVNRACRNLHDLARKVFWEHTSELWGGRHSREMTAAQADGVFALFRTVARRPAR